MRVTGSDPEPVAVASVLRVCHLPDDAPDRILRSGCFHRASGRAFVVHNPGVYDDLHLVAGERLLWSGTPARHPVFDSADFAAVPVSLAWCGFAVFWESGVMSSGAPVFMQIWGIPFVLVGLYLVVGRLVVRRLQMRSTTYAVTDRRVIETVRRPRLRVTEAYLRDLPPPVTKIRDDGTVGSIAFGSFPGLAETLADMGVKNLRRSTRTPRRNELREIAQPQHVREIIASAQN